MAEPASHLFKIHHEQVDAVTSFNLGKETGERGVMGSRPPIKGAVKEPSARTLEHEQCTLGREGTSDASVCM